MSKGNLKDQGGKGTNFPFQLAVLQLLDQILIASGGAGPTGGATEATQLLVKAAVDAININTSDVATETTLTVLKNYFTPVTRIPSLLRTTGAGTVAAGARSVSVFNAGLGLSVWLGAQIKPGEQFSYSAGGEGDLLAEFAYDGAGNELVIITVV
jgi:NADPH:quinone reductase-like Zn-dependent oxidoreductase